MNYYNYFTEIEEAFIRRRGKNLLLSPLDWALIEDWQEREIPLHVVLRAIDTVFDVFDRQPIRPRTIKSLQYCREEIEAQYTEWAAMQAGSNGDGEADTATGTMSDAEIAEHIAAVSSALKDAASRTDGGLKDAIERILARLYEINESRESAEGLEKALDNLDSVVDRSLAALPEAVAVRGEIADKMAAYKGKMTDDVYERTIELMLIKRLREDLKLPRLSLFHL